MNMNSINPLLEQDTRSWDLPGGMDVIQGETNLHKLRKEIDKQDWALLDILARRISLVKNVALLKEKGDLPYRDPERERQLLEDRIARGKAAGLDTELVAGLFQLIMEHSLRLQVKGSTKPDAEA